MSRVETHQWGVWCIVCVHNSGIVRHVTILYNMGCIYGVYSIIYSFVQQNSESNYYVSGTILGSGNAEHLEDRQRYSKCMICQLVLSIQGLPQVSKQKQRMPS